MRAMRVAALVLLVACSSPTKPVAPKLEPAKAELSPALEKLAWWLGDWDGEHGSEHWVAVDGAMFGVALLKNGNFEVLVIDDAAGAGKADGVVRLWAMPGGSKSIQFKGTTFDASAAKFENPGHDYPKWLTYTRNGDALVAVTGGDHDETFSWKRSTLPRAPELEAADRAFSDDTGKRKIEGWLAAFDEKGSMIFGTGRVEGHAAISAEMKELLDEGTLSWEPIASGRRGDLGFTIGKGTYEGKVSFRSVYATIWKKRPDGTWKVWFDTGRTVNE